MAAILGTNVGAPVVPYDSLDIFPSHKAIYGLGGLRTVADTAARNAIPVSRLEEGCQVYVTATGKTYRLKAGFANPTIDADWADTSLFDSIAFGNGTRQASLGYSTANTPNALVLGFPSASNILNFCSEADIGFDWGVPLVNHPAIILHSSNQVKNEYAFWGIGESGGVPKTLVVFAGGGDDIDGTARNSDGFDLLIGSGFAGSLGGIPGHVKIYVGGAFVGNQDAGDILINFANGSGTGRKSVIMADGANADMRFKNNGTGVFRIEDSGSSAALTLDHNGTNGVIAATTGAINFSNDISAQADIRAAASSSIFGLGTQTELTIAGGVVTATRSRHSIDTEGDAASDDLDTITATNFVEGDILVIRANNSARTVVVKSGTGNIKLDSGNDISLDNADDRLFLEYDGSNWVQFALSNNGV